jgi:hypothetical protein
MSKEKDLLKKLMAQIPDDFFNTKNFDAQVDRMTDEEAEEFFRGAIQTFIDMSEPELLKKIFGSENPVIKD